MTVKQIYAFKKIIQIMCVCLIRHKASICVDDKDLRPLHYSYILLCEVYQKVIGKKYRYLAGFITNFQKGSGLVSSLYQLPTSITIVGKKVY